MGMGGIHAIKEQVTEMIQKMISKISDVAWISADKAGMMTKSYIPVDEQTFGPPSCDRSTQQMIDDEGWKEKGKIPWRLWWDSECQQAQHELRKCES